MANCGISITFPFSASSRLRARDPPINLDNLDYSHMASIFGSVPAGQKDPDGDGEESEPKNIWVACSDGDLDRVTALLDEGVSPNDKDDNELTPLNAAASYGRAEVVELLVSRGADVNAADGDGDTALHACVEIKVGHFPRWRRKRDPTRGPSCSSSPCGPAFLSFFF